MQCGPATVQQIKVPMRSIAGWAYAKTSFPNMLFTLLVVTNFTIRVLTVRGPVFCTKFWLVEVAVIGPVFLYQA
jgi:hypothetical protein